MIKTYVKYSFLILSVMAGVLLLQDVSAFSFSSAGRYAVQLQTSVPVDKNDPSPDDLRQRLMDFFEDNLPESFASWINRSIRFTYDSTLAFVLACLICYFFLSTALIVISIMGNNINRAIHQRRHKKLRGFYQANLIDFIFNNDLGAFARLACHRRKMGRAVLLDEIMKMQKDVNGEAYESLRDLYIALDLDRKSIKKILRMDWPGKITGIKEVTEMDVRSALPIIDRYHSSANEVLRSEAQIGLVRLNTKDPFYFLDHFKGYLTRFEQLKIYNIVKRYSISVPDFSRWFNSGNDSVVIFSINMAVLFNQGYAEKQLARLLNHANPKVREAVIYAIGNLGLMDMDRRLMDLYTEEMDINKLAILRTLQKIPDERQIGFLADITDEGNFDRQFEAVKALYEIGELGRIRLIKIDKERDESFKKIVKHVYDGRI